MLDLQALHLCVQTAAYASRRSTRLVDELRGWRRRCRVTRVIVTLMFLNRCINYIYVYVQRSDLWVKMENVTVKLLQ